MNILSFFRRAKSRHADDKAVDNFARVARDKGLLPKQSAFDAALEDEARDREAYFNKIEKLVGVRPTDP
ncbi:hypothetical protein [Bradyrhizobium sp. G127]|uniref:hypothetical protein n=1 Tax=Bradyrhizobium sp. G127 TaxID=2904800 RepID=UPI001F4528BF|nr:hypothetical protein [Bradyrhizobium sp. G127]MCF2522367.1 hypothetical protein [Bradyrhizobium sp. G127]